MDLVIVLSNTTCLPTRDDDNAGFSVYVREYMPRRDGLVVVVRRRDLLH